MNTPFRIKFATLLFSLALLPVGAAVADNTGHALHRKSRAIDIPHRLVLTEGRSQRQIREPCGGSTIL